MYRQSRNFKDTNPLMSPLLVILFGVVYQFCRFWIWSATFAEICPQYNSTPPPHPPQQLTVCIYCTFSLGKGGGQREGREATVHKYSSFVQSMGATVHKLGQKYQPWVNVSPVYKICLTQCRKVFNRSILKKSRHLGFGVLTVHLSMHVTIARCIWQCKY